MSFYGYKRENGWVGTRNTVGIISLGSCTNDPAMNIARMLEGHVTYFGQDTACQNGPEDEKIYYRTMINIGKNPNIGAVLLVGPNCGCIDSEKIKDSIAEVGKRVESISIHDREGIIGCIAKGMKIAQEMVSDISKVRAELFDDSYIRLGLTCGGSTPLSGVITNAVMGKALDMLIANGGCGGFCETPEIIGAEHILAATAINDQVKEKLLNTVKGFRKRFKDAGVDLVEGNPSKQNINDGISSLEEKAIGAISKAGSTPLMEVVEYGERPEGKGLFFVDSPGNDLACMLSLLAAGCNVISYSTESCCPYGVPFVPVIKVTANEDHFYKYTDILDYYFDTDIAIKDIKEAGEAFYNKILSVASGEKTKGEILGYFHTNRIFTVNPLA